MKFFLKSLISPFIFLYDLVFYKIYKKKNCESSYKFLIFLFCLTGGMSNKILDFILSRPKKNIQSEISVIMNINEDEAKDRLFNYGFYYKENAIAHQNISEIKEYLKTLKGRYISDNYISLSPEYFEEKNPKAVKFVYNSKDLIECKNIQEIVIDKNLYNIVSNYFDKEPILDSVLAYWSVPSKKEDSNAAQIWHFDLERTKWLKVFIYLTDCNENNGPHYFIQKSHLDDGINFEIRKKGYKRIEDELIDNFYKKEDIKCFTSLAGGLLIEDTRGLHKGKKVDSGYRLILQLQYSTNLFGASTVKIAYPNNRQIFFEKYINKNKFFFSNFI
jgi:ectoine hydroxylase-related dioxygenase (phytanoyl-CoA dioxygenase family)